MKFTGSHLLLVMLLTSMSTFPTGGTISNDDPATARPIIDENLETFMDVGKNPQDESIDRLLVLSTSNEKLLDSIYPRIPVGKNYLHILPRVSQSELRSIYLKNGIISIMPDKKIDHEQSPLQSGASTQSYVADEILGTPKVWNEYNITGDGVILGIVDSGVDFGHTDLEDSPVLLPSGITASFDASGDGIAVTNNTVSSYQNGDKTYLPLSGLELWGRVGPSNSMASNLEFGIELNDLEITAISKPSISNNYKTGLIIHPSYQQDVPWQIFVFVLTDSVSSGLYDTLYIDMDTSLALSLAYNGLIFESGSTYLTLVDWSLTDEVPYGKDNPIVNRDIDGDGVADVSAGAISTSINFYPEISNQIYIRGIDPLGKALVLMYDVIGHGTLTAGAAAGRGKVNYPLFDDATTENVENSTTVTLPGSAPNAKIIATKGITLSDYVLGWFWLAGLEFSLSGQLDQEVPEHRADIASNSWGDASLTNIDSPKGLDIYSMLLDLLSVPDRIYPGYPGMIFVVATGNGGPGYGTVATPGAASLAISVGASNNYVFLNNTGRNDVAWFSSRGPTAYGSIKPDIVAPGNTGYTTYNVIMGYGNGTYAAGLFGGTSEATPRVAGVVALMIEALYKQSRSADLGTIRTILKSTARNTGFHSAIQGAGLADAYAAVSSINGGSQLIFSNTVSSKVLLSRLSNTFFNYFGEPHPLEDNLIEDTTLLLDESQLSNGFSIDVKFGNGTLVDTSSMNFNSQQLVLNNFTNFSFSSISAETTTIDLDSMLPSNYKDADLLQISLSLTEESWNSMLSVGIGTPNLLLYDDQTGRIIYDVVSQRTWAQQLYSGLPKDDFAGNPELQFSDPGYVDSIPNWQGLDYLGYAQAFTYQDTGLDIVNTVAGFDVSGSFNEYQFGVITTAGYQIPFLFAPIDEVGYLDDAHSYEIQTGVEVPYNQDEAYGAMDWGYRPESGDFRFFQFRVPANATYFVVQVSWAEENFIPDLFLYNDTASLVTTSQVEYLGGGFYESAASEDKKQNLIVRASEGVYTLVMHYVNMPFKPEPTQFTVKTRYLTISEFSSPTSLFSQNTTSPITGMLSLEVDNYEISEFPELYVSAMDTQIVKGKKEIIKDTIVIDEQFEGYSETLDTVEHTILISLEKGERVDMVLSWIGLADLDMYVLSANDAYEKSSDLLNGLGTSPGIDFEYGSFAAPETGAYLILVDYILSDPVMDIDYTLVVDSKKGPTIKSNVPELGIDTSVFPNDGYSLIITYYTNFGLTFKEELDVVFENHKIFTSSLTQPGNGDILSNDVTVTWDVSVAVQGDVKMVINKVEYILGMGIKTTSFTFDSTIFPNGPAKLVVVLSNGVFSNIHEISITLDNDNPSSIPSDISTENSLNLILTPLILALALFYKRRKNHWGS